MMIVLMMMMSEVEEKKKKSVEVETALDTAVEMYRSRLGFDVKFVRGNGVWTVLSPQFFHNRKTG